VVGVATHFANIEDTLEHEFAGQQLDCFRAVVERMSKALGEVPPFVHAACSAASLLFRETDFSLARVGISMYGHWPSRETKLSWILEHGRDGLDLQPVLSWRATIGQLQRVSKAETVGYGRTWRALRDTTLGVVPVGYSDGYSRSLGNRARVAVRGRLAPVVGRVCMNIFMVDVTDLPEVGVGDRVTLIGADNDVEITVEDLAALSGTINYEFLARLSPAIPRIVR
jgi:alanine racemase